MSEQTQVPNPLISVADRLRDELSANGQRLESEGNHLVSCKGSHRVHTVNWKALKPARQLLQSKDSLPKPLWYAAVGSYFIEALRTLAELEHGVRRAVEKASLLHSDLRLLISVEPTAGNGDVEKALTRVSQSLANQLLPELRQEAVNGLRDLLQDCDPTIARVREALRDSLADFIESEMHLASVDAGYHTVPNGEMSASEMLRNAEAASGKHNSALSEAVSKCSIGRQSQTQITLDNYRAIALALLAYPQIAARVAAFAPGSIVRGRMDFVQDCIAALVPAPEVKQEPGAPLDVVAYRMRACHERVSKKHEERRRQFERDALMVESELNRAAQQIGTVNARQMALDACHVLS